MALLQKNLLKPLQNYTERIRSSSVIIKILYRSIVYSRYIYLESEQVFRIKFMYCHYNSDTSIDEDGGRMSKSKIL